MPGTTKQHRIMEAAEQLFTGRRFHEVTLDEVCRKAGVGKGTIYKHFKDKDHLFLSVVMSGFEELHDLILSISSANQPFEEQLRRVLSAVGRIFVRKRQFFRMMQSEETRAIFSKGDVRQTWIKRRRELIRAVSDILQRGVRGGIVRRDIAPDVMAACLLGMLRGSLMQGEALNDAEPIDDVTELFLRGARFQETATAGRGAR